MCVPVNCLAEEVPKPLDQKYPVASLALDLLENARAPRTTEQSPYRWNGAGNWQRDYSNARILSKEEIASRREEFDRVKRDAKRVRAADQSLNQKDDH